MEKVFMITVSNLLSHVPPLFSDLAKIIAGEIDCSQKTLSKYSNDGSPYQIFPQAVIYPKNVTDIKHVLSFAREYKIPVTPCGKREGRNGGALGEGIILDMTRYFSQIRTINMMENIVTVDAGVTVASLLEKLHSWQFDIPLFSLSDKTSTIGALVATKSGTAGSFFHGTIREWIEEVTVVVDNGEEHKLADGITPSGRLLGIYQEVFPLLTKENPTLRADKPLTHDDASGYNLWNTSIGPRQLIDQITGSEGTLGIITSVTFRTTPYRPHTITTCIPISDKKLLPSYVEIAKHHKAEQIFLYDETFMQLAERYHPKLVPFFIDTEYVLLVTHTSIDKEKLHHLVKTFKAALPLEDYIIKTMTDSKVTERITGQEFLFSLFSMYTNDILVPVTSASGLIVTLPQIPSFLTLVNDYLGSLGKLYTITGNIGSGHVSPITLFDPHQREYDQELLTYTEKLFSFVKKYDGGISALDGEGLAKTPFIGYAYNEATLSLFKKIKNIWDPLSILNPGKKIGTTTSYLKQHTKRPPAEDE